MPTTRMKEQLSNKERALIALRNVTNVNSRGFKTLTKEIARTREACENKFK